MLTIHHLGLSQSERIVWLCEELKLDYELKCYQRRADNKMAPPDYKSLHPLGVAPVITDGDLVLGESGAIIEYLVEVYGRGGMTIKPGAPGYTDYLYWLHFANGTFQALILRMLSLERVDASGNNAPLAMAKERFQLMLSMMEKKLGESDYLTGDTLTAADIMIIFSLTTMRLFKPYDLSQYPNILAYLQRIGARPAYQRAMQKAEPDLTPVLGAKPSKAGAVDQTLPRPGCGTPVLYRRSLC
ncbi:Glutathione S-transferase [Hahella chejuensis KCTC 2396]|uniref:glutathione transferase n=1 Tax=Hahella chejuensis (strain KCTC 2396) TaxID=349521 RepID=Q2S8U1_HAHCH|nr:glutathione S-transferase family protein [Hahella chejuensis]ABC32933.1 Glutathione S-transferase [Hahella chejuensis KCTC 2396]